MIKVQKRAFVIKVQKRAFVIKVQVSVVGYHPRPEVVWPEGWPIPRVGDEVTFPDKSTRDEDYVLFVRTVVWYPHGSVDESSTNTEPFIYVVVGPKPPV